MRCYIEKINEITYLMFKEFPDCVGVQDLQKMLGIKRTKTYELLKSGTIKSIKIGKDYKISKINVVAYLLGGEQI
ncbi:MAG: helix-turn-helix domain-containing protein [Clostridia bacterium]